MSPASYRAAPPRVGEPNFRAWCETAPNRCRSLPCGRLVRGCVGRLVVRWSIGLALVGEGESRIDLVLGPFEQVGPLRSVVGTLGRRGLVEQVAGLLQEIGDLLVVGAGVLAVSVPVPVPVAIPVPVAVRGLIDVDTERVG